MIRKAQEKDIDAIVDLGVEFGIRSQAIHTLTVDPEKIRQTVLQALKFPSVVLLVLEVNGKIEGVIFGVEVVSFFTNESVLQELAMYSKVRGEGVRLINAFENEASKMGIKKIVMGSKPDFYDLKKIYDRRGYKLLEEHYIKIGV